MERDRLCEWSGPAPFTTLALTGPSPLPPAHFVKALVHIDREQCLQLDLALTCEWLETDRLGGFASSTVLLCNRRRYHGLLVTAPAGLAKRHVFLSRFDESLWGAGRSFPLSIARYPGLWAPQG